MNDRSSAPRRTTAPSCSIRRPRDHPRPQAQNLADKSPCGRRAQERLGDRLGHVRRRARHGQDRDGQNRVTTSPSTGWDTSSATTRTSPTAGRFSRFDVQALRARRVAPGQRPDAGDRRDPTRLRAGSWTASCVDGPVTSHLQPATPGSDSGHHGPRRRDSVNSGYMAMVNQIDLCPCSRRPSRSGSARRRGADRRHAGQRVNQDVAALDGSGLRGPAGAVPSRSRSPAWDADGKGSGPLGQLPPGDRRRSRTP